MFDAQIITSLFFIALAITTIFGVKNRTSTIIALVIIHLTLIFFLSRTITNYNSFKEIILTLITYLMVVLFLITNYDIAEPMPDKTTISKHPYYKKIIGAVIFFMIFSSLFYLSSNALYVMKRSRNNHQISIQAPSPEATSPTEDRKTIFLKKKLSENFLLKRSSDIILIIVAATSIILLLQRRNNLSKS